MIWTLLVGPKVFIIQIHRFYCIYIGTKPVRKPVYYGQLETNIAFPGQLVAVIKTITKCVGYTAVHKFSSVIIHDQQVCEQAFWQC